MFAARDFLDEPTPKTTGNYTAIPTDACLFHRGRLLPESINSEKAIVCKKRGIAATHEAVAATRLQEFAAPSLSLFR